MTSLVFGIIAALCWGIHDVCVRYLSQRTNIFTALFLVVLIGTLLLSPVALVLGTGTPPNIDALLPGIASGLAFAIAGIALYKAFSIGPVRLVAPIMGAYPILSVSWAAISGTPLSGLQWLAVLVVVGGIAIVAIRNTSDNQIEAPISHIVAWAALSAVGWALTFAFGQAATRHGDPYDLLLITRIVATLALIPVLLWVRPSFRLDRRTLVLLCVLGCLDAIALSFTLLAGPLPNPEFASVAASVFGIITIILARIFLAETMSPSQWFGVFLAFCGIGYLAI